MATLFSYQAKNRFGQLQNGSIEADDAAAVARYLRERGFVATRIAPQAAGQSKRGSCLAHYQRVSLRDLSVFCRQFATLFSAGISMIQALNVLVEQTENRRFRQVLQLVIADVQTGETLSFALRQHNRVFPPVMVSMVEAGELGGMLDVVMARLADQFEKEHKLNARLRSALTYPLVVLGMAALSLAFILAFVLPTFIDMFAGMKMDLPWSTKLLLSLSDLLRNDWPWLLGALAGAGVLFSHAKEQPAVRKPLDRLLLILPVFGSLAKKVAIARFSRTFSGLIRSGVPMIASLEVVKNTVANVIMVEALDTAQASVTRGDGLAPPLRQNRLFAPMVVHMIAVGEETGELEQMLVKIADFYEAEVDDMVSRLSSLLDPLLIVVLGVVIGFIVVSIMLPMLEVVTNFNRAV